MCKICLLYTSIEHVRDTVKETDPAFLIHTGDICYEDGLKQHIKDMNTENMGVPVRYVIGNHDYVAGKYGEALFESIYEMCIRDRFSFDATRFLRKGKNRIAVRCSNAPSATALPNKGDFDWADDGGLIRAVEFLQKERRDVKDCRITPSILQYLPQGRCRAELTVDASLFAEETQLQELSILDRAGRTVLTQNVLFQNGRLHACLTLENALLWEPEFPNLYTLAFRSGSSRSKFRFGVRELTCLLYTSRRSFCRNSTARISPPSSAQSKSPLLGRAVALGALEQRTAMRFFPLRRKRVASNENGV